MRIRIITDDFTSALDGTACFAEHGWETAVLIRPDGAETIGTTDVASLDTDSRERAPTLGRGALADAAHAWCDADVLAVQFDSTLRGRVALDCITALAASGRGKLLIAPAFPSAGRTVGQGCVHVDGVPVHETASVMPACPPWLVVGSLNPRSRRQLAVARAQCRINVLATEETRSPAGTAAQAALGDLVPRVTNALHSGACDGLVVTGGETARRIIDALPAVSLRVRREIMPGVPLAEVKTATGTFSMITKAGGFGEDDALVTCINILIGV